MSLEKAKFTAESGAKNRNTKTNSITTRYPWDRSKYKELSADSYTVLWTKSQKPF